MGGGPAGAAFDVPSFGITPQSRSTPRALRACGVRVGEYMTRFAFYLSCLFCFVFLFLFFTYQIFCYVVRSTSLFLVVPVVCQI